MATTIQLSFQPTTACNLPGVLYTAQDTVHAIKNEGAAKYFAAHDKIAAAFKQAAALTLDQLTPGAQSTGQGSNIHPGTWTRQEFAYFFKDAVGQIQSTLTVSVSAQNQLQQQQCDSLSTFAIATVTIAADNFNYELGVEIQGYASELAKAAGTTAIGVALFKMGRAGARALWNSLRSVFQKSGTDASILENSTTLAGASESAVGEEMAGDVLAESMVEMEGLTEIAGVMSTCAPVAIPVAILLGALLLIGLLIRKKVVIITHEVHLIDNTEHQSFLMSVPAGNNYQMIQYPSLSSDSSKPIADNFQPVLPFPSTLDLAMNFQSDSMVAAVAIFKFTNSDHHTPLDQAFFLALTPAWQNGYGYQLCFLPTTNAVLKTYITPKPSVKNATSIPSSGDNKWTHVTSALEPSGTAAPFSYNDPTTNVTITVTSSYSHTPSSGSDNPETWAYRTAVIVEQVFYNVEE